MNFIHAIIFISALWSEFNAPPPGIQYWIRQPAPTNQDLSRLSFTDTLNGWAVGLKGTIIHTSNGGTNWVIQHSPITYSIQDVFFVNERLGWGIANDYLMEGTAILKTTDGGDNWSSSLYPDTTLFLNTIYFVDSLNGFMGGYFGTILKTTNSGNNWTKCRIDSSILNFYPILKFSFYNLQSGVAGGGINDAGGVMWRTTDSGYNWAVCNEPGLPIRDMLYIDSLAIIAAGGEFDIGSGYAKSYDNGKTWSNNLLSWFGVGEAVALRTRTEIWISLGFSQTWAVTFDSTTTWNLVQVADSQAILDAKFVDPYHGWAVGTAGSVYKYNTDLIGIHMNQNTLPVTNKLSQNYPNPFNITSKFKVQISRPANAEVNVYDITGKRIAKLLDKKLGPGEYSISFDGGNCASGIYFYSLIIEGKIVDSKKMVLIK